MESSAVFWALPLQPSLRLNFEELDAITPGLLGVETTSAGEMVVINAAIATGKKALA